MAVKANYDSSRLFLPLTCKLEVDPEPSQHIPFDTLSEADTNQLQVRFHWSSSNTHGAHNGSRLNLGTGTGGMPQRHISDLIPALLRQLRQLHVSVVTSQRPQQRWHLFQPAMRCHALPCAAMRCHVASVSLKVSAASIHC